TVGAAERAVLLLTTDEEVFPHACLLSRAQVKIDGNAIRIVVTSRFSADNLRRTGHATLIVGDEQHLHSCKLLCESVDDSVAGMTAFSLSLRWHKADGGGAALTPLSFIVDDGAPERERWNECADVLEMKNAV